MAKVLNSLVISEDLAIQRTLENIMSNNIEDYVQSFVTYPPARVEEVDREPDIVFIENNRGQISTETVQRIIHQFPGRTYVVLQPDPEPHRRMFIRAGIDEVMSLDELQSGIGRHMLEKLVAWKDLAAAEALVERSEERFRDIIEHSHDMITLLDADGTVIYTSPAFGRQTGYESWEVLGQDIGAFVHDEDRARLQKHVQDLINAPEVRPIEFRFRRSDGEWRHVEAVATNLLNNETVQAIVLNSRDITEEKNNELELERYRQHLEDIVELRTRELRAALETERMIVEQQKTFVSMVSHEFRTPLTIIDGNAQIIQRRGSTIGKEALEKRATTIRAAVERLVRLIETILSSHMLDSGKIAFEPAACDLPALIRGMAADQQELAPSHRIAVDISGVPSVLQLDEKLMRHIIGNLLGNAVKYAPDSPDISVRAGQRDGGVYIEVEDKGVGIPDDEQAKIFDKYYRATTSGGIPGSGLGLSLVKQFVEMHGGRIALKSKTGRGTTIIVTLPAA